MANPGDIINNMQQEEWDDFIQTSYPMLQSQAQKLKTLDTDMYNQGIKNTETVIAMSKQARDQQREAMGMDLSGQDELGQNRYDALTATQAMTSAGNQSVEDSLKVKTNVADMLLGTQTTLKNQALADASSAARLQSSRQQQGIANDAQDKAQTMNTLGTVASVGIMLF